MEIFEFWFYKFNSLRLITREFEKAYELNDRKSRKSESAVVEKRSWLRPMLIAWVKEHACIFLNRLIKQPSSENLRTKQLVNLEKDLIGDVDVGKKKSSLRRIP